MYCRPMTVMFRDLPLGGSLGVGARVQLAAFADEVGAVGVGVGRVLDRAELANVRIAEPHQDHRRADRPAGLQTRVPVDLRGHRALARAELDERVSQPADDRDEDHQGDDEDDLVELSMLFAFGDPPDSGVKKDERCGYQVAQGGQDSIQARTERA